MGRKSREKSLRPKPIVVARRAPAAAARAEVVEPPLPEAPPPTPWSELWQTHGRDAVLLFGFALAVRLVLLAALAVTPFVEVENIDSKGYVEWAQRILGEGWWPKRHFYQSPLYAYYLAALYGIFGANTWVPRLVQVLAGSVSVVLLYAIGRRIFSRRVGVIAGVLLALYGPLILEELMLSKTVLVITSALAGFALYLRALPRVSLGGLTAAGVVFGITVIGVGQFLPCVLLLAVWAVVAGREWRPDAGAVVLAGAMLGMGPVVAWNNYAAGGFLLTSADAGLNLYLGNNPLTTGLAGRPTGLRDIPEFEEDDSRRLAEQQAGRPLRPAEVSQYWSGRAVAWALERPVDFVALMARKFRVLWYSYEIPDSYHYGFMREEFMSVLWACVTFAIVGPLALVGLVLAWRQPGVGALYVAALGYLGTVLLFYVRSRYRLPGIPFLIPFAAVTVDWLWRTAAARRWQALGGVGAALAGAALFVNAPYCEPSHHGFPSICLTGKAWYDLEWMKLGQWYEERNDLDRALGYVRRAADTPDPRGPGQIAFWLGHLERTKGDAVAATDPAAATDHFTRAAAAFDDAVGRRYRLGHAATNLALAYARLGRPDEALAASETALAAAPKDDAVALNAIRLRADLGRCDDVRRLLDGPAARLASHPEAQSVLAACAAS